MINKQWGQKRAKFFILFKRICRTSEQETHEVSVQPDNIKTEAGDVGVGKICLPTVVLVPMNPVYS